MILLNGEMLALMAAAVSIVAKNENHYWNNASQSAVSLENIAAGGFVCSCYGYVQYRRKSLCSR